MEVTKFQVAHEYSCAMIRKRISTDREPVYEAGNGGSIPSAFIRRRLRHEIKTSLFRFWRCVPTL